MPIQSILRKYGILITIFMTISSFVLPAAVSANELTGDFILVKKEDDDKQKENERRDQENKRREQEDRKRQQEERKRQDEERRRQEQEQRKREQEERRRQDDERRKQEQEQRERREAEDRRKQDQQRREQDERRRQDNERKQREENERGRGRVEKDPDAENQRHRGIGEKKGHDKDKDKDKKDHDDNRDRGKGRKEGHKKNGKKDRKEIEDHELSEGEAELIAEILKLIIRFNLDAWYTPYPYAVESPNFIENWVLEPGSFVRSEISGEKYGQDVPSYYRKVFFNLEWGGQYMAPNFLSTNVLFHGRLLGIIGPMLEYQGVIRDSSTYDIFKAGFDLPILQFANISFSAYYMYTWFYDHSNAGTIYFEDHSVGGMLMIFPVKPISLTIKYTYLDHDYWTHQTTQVRLGIHLNRFEIYTGYYRQSFEETGFYDGVEAGTRLWF